MIINFRVDVKEPSISWRDIQYYSMGPLFSIREVDVEKLEFTRNLDKKYFSKHSINSQWKYSLIEEIHNDLINNGYDYSYDDLYVDDFSGKEEIVSRLNFTTDEAATYFKLTWM